MSSLGSLDHEVKFLFPHGALSAVLALLHGRCRRDRQHPESIVESIYLDAPGLSALGEKRNSDYRKSKFRLRWYDGAGTVWLERKRRFGSRRDKLRVEIALDAAELTRRGLAAAKAETLRPAVAALGGEGAATPVARLRYRRRRFELPGGERLAVDSSIELVEVDRRRLARATQGPLRLALIELKGRSRELPPLLAPLAALGLRRASFSKFGLCVGSGAG